MNCDSLLTLENKTVVTLEQHVRVPSSSVTQIPVIDFKNLYSDSPFLQQSTLAALDEACKEWGFFHLVNHEISPQLMDEVRVAWTEFFHLPHNEKQVYSNLPPHFYEGFGSRLGVEEGAKVDWSYYFFIHLLPHYMRDKALWHKLPFSLSKTIEQYHEELNKVAGELIKILSKILGLDENHLSQVLGGEKTGVYLRANFYPKCPHPDTIFGLSSHSDPGAFTLLLAGDNVTGLQVLKGETWISVEPIPNAIIINIGDQIQVLTNGKYKSSEHRVIANPDAERMSVAWFYNPKGDQVIEPIKELVTQNSPALYNPQTFDDYITFMATNGPCGKSQVESLKLAGDG